MLRLFKKIVSISLYFLYKQSQFRYTLLKKCLNFAIHFPKSVSISLCYIILLSFSGRKKVIKERPFATSQLRCFCSSHQFKIQYFSLVFAATLLTISLEKTTKAFLISCLSSPPSPYIIKQCRRYVLHQCGLRTAAERGNKKTRAKQNAQPNTRRY